MRKGFLLGLLAILIACQQRQPADPAKTEERSWSVKMNELSTQLRQLMPFIYSPAKFEEESQFRHLNELIGSFAQTVGQVKSHPTASFPETDPSMLVTLSRMQEDLNDAKESFAQKDFAFARANLKTVTQYCSYCHTRHVKGMQNSWLKDPIELTGASAIEKADFFVATRQFDRAKEELKSVFLQTGGGSFESERAVKKYLVVALRATDDPQGAKDAIEGFLRSGESSYYFKKLARVWLDDLKLWREPSSVRTELSQIKRRLDRADARKDFAYDESATIVYLNMSELLYDLLSRKQSAEERAETYYLLGRTYEVLRGVGLWNLNEIYYESCIRKHPHSVLAVRCYKSFEQSTVLGYSGSGGVFVPPSVRIRLVSLKELAEPFR